MATGDFRYAFNYLAGRYNWR